MDESFYRSLATQHDAAAAALKSTAAQYGATSKVRRGLLDTAAAHAEMAVLWRSQLPVTPPVDPPPPPPPPPASNGLDVARSLTAANCGYLGNPVTLPTFGSVGEQRYLTVADNDRVFENVHIRCMLRWSDKVKRLRFRNVHFTVHSWYGLLDQAMDEDAGHEFVNCTWDGFDLAGNPSPVDNIGAVIFGSKFIRCRFAHLDNAARIGGGTELVEVLARDPHGHPASHVDCIEVYGAAGKPIKIDRSNLRIVSADPSGDDTGKGATAALNIAPDFAPIGQIDVTDTVLAGGGGTLLIRQQGSGKLVGPFNFRNVEIEDYLWFPINRDASYAPGLFGVWENVRDLKTGALIAKPV